ncbi:calcium-binding protein [Falsiroseomonas selenitidurans]|uniref:Calcium-binding protein n=1 Tax=Falsiroseomonas selenitidurans TaxID=2716335 RepID=A0ABX1E163_9PROT|nr:calcium-binding protein [Falsiroseomonas selenitidurans]NKC29502.1 calcium-binding protein [Falsiroseomonas selenitidurans]
MTQTSGQPQALSPEALDAVTGGAVGGGNDSVRGGSGSDYINAQGGNDSVAGGAAGDMLDGGAGNDLVMGNSGNDTITGGAGDDVLIGGTGADIINGDQAYGTQGNDVIRWHPGEGNDTINGGGGTDQLVLEDTGMSLQQLFSAITLDQGSARPVLGPHSINLTGVSGTITIGGETIRFSGMESLVAGSYQYFSGRSE